MSFNAPGPPPGPSSSKKVAIPRLQRTSHSTKENPRRRVTRACTACRSHKIKCTGDSPQCKHCESTGRECIYIMPRKDRLKALTERCAQITELLKRLRGFANEEDGVRIGELLDAAEEDWFEARETPAVSNPDTNDDDPDVLQHTRTVERLRRLNTVSLDLLAENLHENDQSRATGFVGQHSEVQWLRSFLLLEKKDDDMSPGRGSRAVTYYLDNQSMKLEFQVDPYELPTSDLAEHLLSAYMEKVHDSFPILPRKLFQEQCRRYFKVLRYGSAPRLNSKWQATLNLVFAIGAKYSHMARSSWQADERDHLVYRARAQAFAWNESTLAQHPDVPQIQVTGLLAFYYMSVGQISRAWVVVGVALRFATALGLHVRNEDPSATGSKREVLVRVWWSLSQLERQISIMTGRPSVVIDSYCSVPLPAPFSEQQILEDVSLVEILRTRSSGGSAISPIARGQPYSLPRRPMSAAGPSGASPSFGVAEANSGSYFKAVVQLCIITQSILTSLYSAETVMRSPNELQQDIIQLDQRLDVWIARLPDDFNFRVLRPNLTEPEAPFLRERTLLAFQYCSAKILLTRPCLGGLGNFESISIESTASAGFPRRMAGICVETAKAEVDLLPDQPYPLLVYEFGPWWTVVHNLMQALAVLLLALSYSEISQDNVVLAQYCTKIILWLRAMDDSLAERAHRVALDCFELVANRLSLPWPGQFTDNQVPLSGPTPGPGPGQDISMQTDHPGVLPIATDMGHGHIVRGTGYDMPDGPSTFFPHDPWKPGMFFSSAEGHEYDGSFYHYPNSI